MSNSERGGKRKRIEIDLTGDGGPTASPATKAQRSSNSSDGNAVAPSASASTGRYKSVYPFGSYGNHQHPQNARDSWLDDNDEDDINDTIDSTQATYEATDRLHHYGNIEAKVVGVQYYRGLASSGETILVRREPSNPYDSNAIRIDNVAGTQIGHVPRRIAGKLAPYMDQRLVHCEGLLAGAIGQFDAPLSIRIFGPDQLSDAGRQLTTQMKDDKLPIKAFVDVGRAEKAREKERQQAEKRKAQDEKKRLAAARRAAAGKNRGAQTTASGQTDFANQSTPGDGGAPTMSEIVEASERFNPRELSQTAEKYGIQEEDLKNMPMAKQPGAIKTTMLPYQLQALKWLLDQESPMLPSGQISVQLWKSHQTLPNVYTNLATNYSIRRPPVLASGGILSDDMGLGKTLEIISLLVADNANAGKSTGTTLIVSPLSVMSNWSDQITRHVHEEHALKVYTYHGAGRVHMTAADLSQYDVVITTYQTLTSDYVPRGKGSKAPEKKLRDSGLYSMQWRRIILDEAHTVRNPVSKGAAACTAVMATSRWCLTGTPIVNSLKDLYCLVRFIGITGGLEELEIFNSALIRPLKSGDASAIFLLQALMAAFTLRRKKDMSFVDLKLPSLEEYVHRIPFTDKEQERYDALNAEANGLLKKYEKSASGPGKGSKDAYQHLLEILLRMRQICNHIDLCGQKRVTNLLVQLETQKTVNLTPENLKALQDMLQVSIESQDDCAICLETLHNPVITICAHAFGSECIKQVIETQAKCPMCRAELKDADCLVQPASDCGDEDARPDAIDAANSSSKLEALLTILRATKAKGDKTVIFSQWTRFLDIVQARLDTEGYKYCRIDGTMSAPKRDTSLRALESDDDTTIMLASLGVCAVGLNLTAANQVILSDSWWAPAIEDQAVDRVHRLGQKKETRVFRLVIEGSIEERTLEIQKVKRKLMMLAFSERNSKRDQQKAGRLADLQKLLS